MGNDGVKAMNTITRLASVLILGSGALLAGCASEEDLAKVRTIAVAADQKADAAIQRSDMAGQKADMAAQRADQAGQLATHALNEANDAERTANAANATAANAKGTADAVQSALNAHTVAQSIASSQSGWHGSRSRRVARNERGERG